jgi:hypothetical protein
MPIQDLLLANKVNVVFHGHDHLYIKQDLDTNGDGVPELIYQEVPQPCRTNQNTSSAAPYGYRVGVMYPSSGHLRVRVTPQQATVEYVRVVIPTDTRAGVPNGTVQHRYTMNAPNAAPQAPSRLVNLSVRSATGTGNDSLIVGLVVGGTGGNLPVLMRAAGPTLGSFGVPGVLADPVLTLNGAGGAVMGSNDDRGPPPTLARSVPRRRRRELFHSRTQVVTLRCSRRSLPAPTPRASTAKAPRPASRSWKPMRAAPRPPRSSTSRLVRGWAPVAIC